MTTEELLAELRGSPTDLARVVRMAALSDRAEVLVVSGTVKAWIHRDPDGWAKVAAWLAAHNKTVREVELPALGVTGWRKG